MNLNEYQDWTQETAVYPCQNKVGGLTYSTLGLAGEGGEVANKVKKILRDLKLTFESPTTDIPEEKRHDLMDECGDCLYYLARVAKDIGYSLEYVAEHNQAKLAKRKSAGTLSGSGDKR